MASRQEQGAMVAKAVRRAVLEHGAPNSFAPSELSAYYGSPINKMQIGLAAAYAVADLNKDGYRASYEDRTFRIEREPE